MNLVCESFKCSKNEALKCVPYCQEDCFTCQITDDCTQCIVCAHSDSCTKKGHFKICWREFYLQFGGCRNKYK